MKRETGIVALLATLANPAISAFHSPRQVMRNTLPFASVESIQGTQAGSVGEMVLDQMKANQRKAREYADTFGLGETEAGLFCLFDSIRKAGVVLGLKGSPFLLRKNDVESAFGRENNKLFEGFFTMKDLQQALEDDFLDASRGSTDNRKGWKIAAVSNPRGDSFEEARMKFEDVQNALKLGTCIFNAAGAHIPKLAGACLAATDGTATPNALNLYVTSNGKRTSAPPHTDKQDVVVVQTSGKKLWRVYMPTDPSAKPLADLFSRGKGDDNLPLHVLEESGTLLLETTLDPGDILFVPAGFPHTTSTVFDDSTVDDTSLHMTINIDTHVWELDYLSARRLALRRGGIRDSALGQSQEEENRYIGKVNELPGELHKDIFDALPLGLLDEEHVSEVSVESVANELSRIAKAVDGETFSQADESLWRETIERLRVYGMALVSIHRDMYLAAIDEKRARQSEKEITAHLGEPKRKAMTPERMQRLSLFRVQRYYEQINKCKAELVEWSYSGKVSDDSARLPEDWAFSLPLKVGDQVEADLGGAFFPATVTRAAQNSYDVKFFDGDVESGLERSMLKLLTPPAETSDEPDTANMTKKQLKRWKKQQEQNK